MRADGGLALSGPRVLERRLLHWVPPRSEETTVAFDVVASDDCLVVLADVEAVADTKSGRIGSAR